MLKITRIGSHDQGTFKLEGKLLGPWVGELLHALGELHGDARAVRLDLSSVTFVDGEGTRVLRNLVRRGAAISACSPFVAALLHE